MKIFRPLWEASQDEVDPVAQQERCYMEVIKRNLNRLTDVKGRSSRSDFWLWVFFIFVLHNVLYYALIYGFSASQFTAQVICGLPSIFLLFAVNARRLNDRNMNGISHSLFYFFVTL